MTAKCQYVTHEAMTAYCTPGLVALEIASGSGRCVTQYQADLEEECHLNLQYQATVSVCSNLNAESKSSAG